MKNIKKYFLFFLIILFFILTTVFLIQNRQEKKYILNKGQDYEIDSVHSVKIAGHILKVDLALTDAEQERGLSGRQNLQENQGMLFVFQKPSKNYFWMKEMNFPIDIIWLDQNFRVIYIENNLSPNTFPQTFGPEQNSTYVLEVSANFSEKNNLQVGDFVQFLP